ncbi:MAG: hypothetical protein PUP46_07895 [Endozoicomonas sp. (ex Botrylloides leachii)]|nr:hypothetical protein [Endozoicomonas sp. (ex Botrylloides leachii)]
MADLELIPQPHDQYTVSPSGGTNSSGQQDAETDYDPYKDDNFKYAAEYLYHFNNSQNPGFKQLTGDKAVEWGINQARWNSANLTSMTKQVGHILTSRDRMAANAWHTLMNGYNKSPTTFSGAVSFAGEMLADPIGLAAGFAGGGVVAKAASTIFSKELSHLVMQHMAGQVTKPAVWAASQSGIESGYDDYAKQATDNVMLDAEGKKSSINKTELATATGVGTVFGAALGAVGGLVSKELGKAVGRWTDNIDDMVDSQEKKFSNAYLNDVKGIKNLFESIHNHDSNNTTDAEANNV